MLKTPFVDRTLEELKNIYGGPSIRADPTGYYLRKVGRSGRRYNPNLQIHVPCLGLPVENSAEINLLRGFVKMPQLTEVMNLQASSGVGFLFCSGYYLQHESAIRSEVCHVSICDPEDSSYVLVITACPDYDQMREGQLKHSRVWHGYSTRLTSNTYKYSECIAYDLIPIGLRNVPEGEGQTADDLERVRREIIHLANQYLGIEATPLSEYQTNGDSESVTHNELAETNRIDIPGLTPGTETIKLWSYCDDLSTEDGWVIDRFGRLLAPTRVIDCSERFMESTKFARYLIWENIPEDTLVLSWSKPSISEHHQFGVILQPEALTRAQLERVASLEESISQLYSGRHSPYGGQESPGINKGWNLR